MAVSCKKRRIIAVTGHRPDKLGGYTAYEKHKAIRRHMRDYLIPVKAEYELTIVSGCALGVDQWWMEVGQYLKIPVIAAIPFEGFDLRWPHASREKLRKLLDGCKEIVYTSGGGYEKHKLQKRNEYMVDRSDTVVAYWSGAPGGTRNCIRYAESTNKPIEIFNPDEIRTSNCS